MLRYRLISGILMGAALLAVAFLLPRAAILPVLLLSVVAAQLEFYGLLDRAGIPCFRWLGIMGGVVLIACTFLTMGPDPRQMSNAFSLQLMVLAGVVLCIFLRQFPQKHNQVPLQTVSATLLGVLYIPFLFNFITLLLTGWEGGGWRHPVSATGRWLTIYLIAVVKCSDIGAYTVGRLIGRHKLMPRISPKKTWEGFFGGIAAAVAVSVALTALLGGRLGVVAISQPVAVCLGVVLALAGVAGDMFESLLKRAAGIKDSGASIPGMGGVLDVFDSLLFSAPILYFVARAIS